MVSQISDLDLHNARNWMRLPDPVRDGLRLIRGALCEVFASIEEVVADDTKGSRGGGAANVELEQRYGGIRQPVDREEVGVGLQSIHLRERAWCGVL